MDLGNVDNASKTDDQETRQEEFDPWQKYAGQLDASGVYAVEHKGKGKGGWRINGNCDHCGQFGHAWQSKGEQWDERILEWTIVDKWE